jgi:hypothetical protein
MQQQIFYRRPETVKVDLPSGGWILLKKYLTAGEARKVFRGMMRRGDTGDEIDPLNVGISKCVIYLVDWSVTDVDGNQVSIRGQSEKYISDCLDNMDAPAFTEILQAVEAHEDTIERERAELKKTLTGEPKFDQISPSRAPSDGDTNGSLNLTETSTANSLIR